MNSNLFPPDPTAAKCRNCPMAARCIPEGLAAADVERFAALVRCDINLGRGEHLFRINSPFRHLYVVRSGSIKSYRSGSDGREQVLSFHLPGEVIGLEAIRSRHHPCSSAAMEQTALCRIPFDGLTDLASRLPSLQQHLYGMLGDKIACDSRLMALLGSGRAEERLAFFLLCVAERTHRGGASQTTLRLSMSREDIGNHLGLALETVSRLLSRFRSDGLIAVEGKSVRLVNPSRLRLLAEGGPAAVSTA